ncbi:unnamed protein product [Effrenium voratum]|uniref:Secreted protein n=1 Tax=Effrenium voratum TaxID=2562239 RepID=A0AA36N1E8_9DINO|nr:unnamed protein product [Effrenium voratum]
MTGCRCCVFLTIFTLSVVFGKSFPKHVGLVKARFGDTLGYGAAGNRSRVQRLRRADLVAAPRVAFLSLFVGRLQVDPIRATGDSLAGHLCGLVSTRPLSSVSGLVLEFEGRVFALPRARLCFDIEAYCPGLRCFRCHGHQCQLIFEVWVPTRQSVRPPDLWLSEARIPPPSRAMICATRAFLLIAPSVLMCGFELSFQGWAQP